MKSSVHITLTEIQIGHGRVLVTPGLDGDDPACTFLSNLRRKDANRFEWIKTCLTTVANPPRTKAKSKS